MGVEVTAAGPRLEALRDYARHGRALFDEGEIELALGKASTGAERLVHLTRAGVLLHSAKRVFERVEHVRRGL